MKVQYKLISSQNRESVLSDMKTWSATGWVLHSFGFATIEIGWYAMMTYTLHPSPL